MKEGMFCYISCIKQELGYFQGILINFETDRGKYLFHTTHIIIDSWSSFIEETKIIDALKRTKTGS